MSMKPEARLCRVRYGEDWHKREDSEEIMMKACDDIKQRNNGCSIRKTNWSSISFNFGHDAWNAFNEVWLTSSEWLALCRRGMPVNKIAMVRKDGSTYYIGYPPRPWVDINNIVVSIYRKLRYLP